MWVTPFSDYTRRTQLSTVIRHSSLGVQLILQSDLVSSIHLEHLFSQGDQHWVVQGQLSLSACRPLRKATSVTWRSRQRPEKDQNIPR